MVCKPRQLQVPAWLALFAIWIGGCGDSATRQPVAEVKGRVFIGDEPLRFGQVIFQPIGGGQPAIGRLASDGSFTLGTYGASDGAAIGRHRVRIVSYTSQSPEQPDDAPSADSLGDLLIPERYSSFAKSGIEVSVLERGNAPFIFKLEPEEGTGIENGEKADAVSTGDQPKSDSQMPGTAADNADAPPEQAQDSNSSTEVEQ